MGPEHRQSRLCTPRDHSHLGGHSSPGRGHSSPGRDPLLMITLGLCPLPPGISRRRAAKKVHSPQKGAPKEDTTRTLVLNGQMPSGTQWALLCFILTFFFKKGISMF